MSMDIYKKMRLFAAKNGYFLRMLLKLANSLWDIAMKLRSQIDFSVSVWLGTCTFLVALMILLGGATRLTDSGLSIVDWKPVFGLLPPMNKLEWYTLFEAYKITTEFKTQNFWMKVDDFKSIYWLEYLHRLFGRVIGIIFFVPFLWFLVRGRLRNGLWWRCLCVFCLGAAQGALGWYMVKSGLIGRTDVSQYRLAAHLSLAVVIYIALLWLTLKCIRPRNPVKLQCLSIHSCLLVITVFLTIVAGGFVAGIDAGFAYNTFPLMNGSYVPKGWLEIKPTWKNFFENVATVQFIHRQLGILVVALAILLWIRSRFTYPNILAARLISLAAACSVFQMGLGIATLLTAVPLFFGLLHQAGAIIMLSFAIGVVYELSAERKHDPKTYQVS
ncbi:MAG: heme A synthase [Rhodospirillaceae bacterium]|nr:heme A synthase [Rhodospirillaceae bacterium]